MSKKDYLVELEDVESDAEYINIMIDCEDEINSHYYKDYKPNFYFKQSEDPMLGFDTVPGHKDVCNCERCYSHEEVDNTLIFQNEDSKWFLRVSQSECNSIILEDCLYTPIYYCPYCGRKLV